MKPKAITNEPIKVSKYANVVDEMNKYTAETDIPSIAEFAYLHHYSRDYLYTLSYSNDALFDAIKTLTDKKEAQLEKLGLLGKINPSMAIFSLKQIGWKDKADEKDTRAVDTLNEILKNMKITAEQKQKPKKGSGKK